MPADSAGSGAGVTDTDATDATATDAADTDAARAEAVETTTPPPGRWSPTPAMQLAANVWFLVLLGYLVVLPAGLLHIGAPLFALTGAAGVVWWLTRVRAAAGGVAVTILGFALAGAIPAGLGILASTPGWRDVTVPLVGGPLLWYFVSHLPDQRAIRRIPTTMAVATIVLATIIILLVLGIGTEQIQVFSDRANGFAVDGEVRVNFPGVSSLIAAVPFLAVLAIDAFRDGDRWDRHGGLVVGALLVGLVAGLMSGRQGVVGAILLTPLLMIATSVIGFGRPRQPTEEAPGRSRTTLRLAAAAVLVIAVGLGVASRLGLDASRVPQDLLASVGLIEDEGNQRVERASGVRAAQGASLLDGWRESPLIGHGGGAVAPDFFTWRGYDIGREFDDTPRPWRAELAYHLLLFESGLLGLGAYIAATMFAVRRLATRFAGLGRRDQRLARASVVAALAIATATAVNPIARAIGHQLMLFLPVIIVAALVGRSADADVVSSS